MTAQVFVGVALSVIFALGFIAFLYMVYSALSGLKAIRDINEGLMEHNKHMKIISQNSIHLRDISKHV